MEKDKVCLLASTNKNKLREISEILANFSFKTIGLDDLPETFEVEETADSFSGNATLKARAYHKRYPELYVLADDSGLEIKALDNKPGIYSSRFGGVNTPYKEKFKMIWSALKEREVPVEDWDARFVCSIAFFEPGDEKPLIFTGKMYGKIIPEARGDNGFGYDPIFYIPEYKKTSAEIDPELKNKISHRGRALEKLKAYLA